MSINETLASASNNFVYSAMAVYTVALGAYAVDLASLGEQVGRAQRREQVGGAQRREQVGGAQKGARSPSRVSLLADAGATRVAVGATAGASGGAGPASAGRGVSGAPTASGGRAGDASLPGLRTVPRRAARLATALTGLALALHVAGVVARGLSAHRAPWGNMYEFTVTGSAVVTAVFLATLLRRDLRFVGAFVVGPVLLALGLAVGVLYTASAQLVPALQSYWLVIHVSVAFVSSALFTLSFSTTLLQLVQERREIARSAGRPPTAGAFMDALPSAAELERTSYRLIAVSFPLWAFTLVAGAIWAEAAWGRYWNWDPKEVWTFIIWVVYAAYLHARATGGWGGRRSAYIALAGFACLLINWGIVNVFFPGQHSYAGIG